MGRHEKSIDDKLWNKVTKQDDGCWIFNARLNDDGYCFVQFEGKLQQAHRVAYKVAVGPIPDGLCVLHSCDTRNCVNPAHLELGTQQKNITDAGIRGNMRRCGAKWLNKDTVTEIKQMVADGKTWRETAAKFGLTRGTVYRIIKGLNKYSGARGTR